MLHPDIQRQIQHLQVRKACQIRPVSAGNGTFLPDRFYLDISYCGLTMRWQVWVFAMQQLSVKTIS